MTGKTGRVSRARTQRGTKRGGTVRKNFNLPQSAIDRAREALGTTTETETVLQALETAADLAAFRAATDALLAELAARGGFEDYFHTGGSEA